MKPGDLIKCQTGDVGLVISEPYNASGVLRRVSVVDVLWHGSDKPAVMDITAIDSGWASVINESR